MAFNIFSYQTYFCFGRPNVFSVFDERFSAVSIEYPVDYYSLSATTILFLFLYIDKNCVWFNQAVVKK